MDILLAHAYYLANDPVERRVMKPYVPLGILSLSAWLKRAGRTVSVFDSTFATEHSFHQRLRDERPRVVGLSINMVTKFAALRMLHMAKSGGTRVVVGGPEPAFYAEEYIREGADVVVIGEGEATLAQVLDVWLDGNGSLSEVPGIVYADADGSIRRTPPRALFPSLDELPIPDREAIDLQPYVDAWRAHHGRTALSVITMRGCPYTCAWCSHSVYGRSYRRRSPARAAEEIEYLVARFAPDTLWFADDVFTISRRWVFELEHELGKRGVRVPFECISRGDRLDADVVSCLARMGCTRVWIGAESGSQRVLDAMSRGVRIGQVEAAMEACRNAGIEVGTFIMLGYLGETREDIEETAGYLRRSRPDIVLTTVAYPIKGTKYYNDLGENAAIPTRAFDQWNDRVIAVHGRYSDRFYWFAHRYITNEAAAGRLAGKGLRVLPRALSLRIKARIAHAGMRLTSRLHSRTDRGMAS